MPPLTPPPTADGSVDVKPDMKERVLGGIGGVLSAGTGQDFDQSPLGKKMSQHHQQRINEATMHHKNASTYAGILSTGKNPQTGDPLTDAERQQYQDWFNSSWGQYEKIAGVDKHAKAALQKSKAVVDHVITQGQQGQQGASGAGAPSGAGAGGGGPLPPPPKADPSSPGAGGGATLAPPPTTSKPYDAQAIAAAPQLASDQEGSRAFNLWKRQEDLMHQHKMEEQAALQKAKGQSGARPRPVHSGSVGVLDARKMAAAGTMFMGENGDPIDVNSLDDTMGLYGMVVRNDDGKWETIYTPFSPNQRTVTVGNETFGVSPMDISKLTQGAGEDLGVHNPTKSGTHESVAIGPGGKLVKNTLGSTSKTATPGVRGRGAAVSGAGAGATDASAGASRLPAPPTATGGATKPPAKAPATPTTKPKPAASGNAPGINGLPPGSYNQMQQQARPARLAATQLFGDPDSPSFKPLSSYADLIDDKGAETRIATAWNLIRNHADRATDGASSGDLTTIIKNYVGTPGAVAESEKVKMEDALKALKPREAEALNRLFSTYGTIIGLRSLTKGSAAKFSARNMEQEVPIFGMNVKTRRAFYDKLSALAEEVNTGLIGMPQTVLRDGEREYFRKQQEDLAQKAGGTNSGRLPAPPKTGGGISTAEELEKAIGKH